MFLRHLIRLLKYLMLTGWLILCLSFCFWLFHQWRKSSRYSEKISIEAYYMKYACGDCSIDMQVKQVNNAQFRMIIGKDIFPKAINKNDEALCNFIQTAASESMEEGMEPFYLQGYLHRYPHGFPLFDCSETPFFSLEKIKYGKHGKWKSFE